MTATVNNAALLREAGGGQCDGIGRLEEAGWAHGEGRPLPLGGGVVDHDPAIGMREHDAALALRRQQGEEVVVDLGGLLALGGREVEERPGQATEV